MQKNRISDPFIIFVLAVNVICFTLVIDSSWKNFGSELDQILFQTGFSAAIIVVIYFAIRRMLPMLPAWTVPLLAPAALGAAVFAGCYSGFIFLTFASIGNGLELMDCLGALLVGWLFAFFCIVKHLGVIALFAAANTVAFVIQKSRITRQELA